MRRSHRRSTAHVPKHTSLPLSSISRKTIRRFDLGCHQPGSVIFCTVERAGEPAIVSTKLTYSLNGKTQTKKRLAPHVCPFSVRRPTNLCVTALLSFQGTNADPKTLSDPGFDRDEKAWRRSHGDHDTLPLRHSQGESHRASVTASRAKRLQTGQGKRAT